ncbi:NlpC/P60 family protein [Streptomyces sp. NPDC005648]|uniref:NlpC/P60 family protein n=1 Tax=Streptomyces sp. NPDC005648 TaxID=3157044 RepID=UPI0033AA7881
MAPERSSRAGGFGLSGARNSDEGPSREAVRQRVSSLYDRAEDDTGQFNLTRVQGSRGARGQGGSARRGSDPDLDNVSRQWFDAARASMGPTVPAILPTDRMPARERPARPAASRPAPPAELPAARALEAPGRPVAELPAGGTRRPPAELTSGPVAELTSGPVAELTAGPTPALPAVPRPRQESAGAPSTPAAPESRQTVLRRSKQNSQRKVAAASDLLYRHIARQTSLPRAALATPAWAAEGTWQTTATQSTPPAAIEPTPTQVSWGIPAQRTATDTSPAQPGWDTGAQQIITQATSQEARPAQSGWDTGAQQVVTQQAPLESRSMQPGARLAAQQAPAASAGLESRPMQPGWDTGAQQIITQANGLESRSMQPGAPTATQQIPAVPTGLESRPMQPGWDTGAQQIITQANGLESRSMQPGAPTTTQQTPAAPTGLEARRMQPGWDTGAQQIVSEFTTAQAASARSDWGTQVQQVAAPRTAAAVQPAQQGWDTGAQQIVAPLTAGDALAAQPGWATVIQQPVATGPVADALSPQVGWDSGAQQLVATAAPQVDWRDPVAQEQARRAADEARRLQQPSVLDTGVPPAEDWRVQQPAAPETTGGATKADRAVAFARAQIGRPCLWGGVGPESYDNSGLAQAAWKAAGVELPRSAHQQSSAGAAIPVTDSRPGDLIFFHDNFSHVGIYTGDGLMIHAPGPGSVIREESIHNAGEAAIRIAVRPA